MKMIAHLRLLIATVFIALYGVMPAAAQTPGAKAVLTTYADIALAGYEDSLVAAKALDAAIKSLIANPSKKALDTARAAWKAARIPYMQTEVYRFGNPIVDAWEGRVNAWPLDEGLIDYVDAKYGKESDKNPLYAANVIANKKLTVVGKEVDASQITPELLSEVLHEAGKVEANVATGYHAIEFLLWGQDINGTDAGAGTRPYTDFDMKKCTGGNCDRRAKYLAVASALLVADLEEMVANWRKDGAARKNLLDGEPKAGLATILKGMGSLSYGELAGERMKLGLLLHDPEEEHDCFSDNTHVSHLYDAIGIRNVYLGTYKRSNGKVIKGASIAQLVAAKDAALDREIKGKLDATVVKFQVIDKRAREKEAYDQMIGEGNKEGNAVVQAAIDALIDQTKSIERAVAVLDLGEVAFEKSDSLDNPNAVFK
ncbi:imelysin family protein [Pseudolabrys sp. FHR47]|uniref:imelysin family protein n=1 Tax=Pseudolabrys sp. FHR47 TaxID=2562284 RepID=UPI0010BE9A2E